LLKLSDEIDFYAVLEYCIENSIDIISASIGTFGSGPGNGTGPVSEAADEARANGIFFVAVAGNSANSSMGGTPYGTHWKGIFYDSDLDDIHEFIPGDSESWYNAVSSSPYQDEDGNPQSNDVTIIMRWNDWPNANTDYNLSLRNYYTGTEVAYSNAIQNGSQPPIEAIVIDLPESENYAHIYSIVISKVSGEPSGIELELFTTGASYLVPFHKYVLPIATSSSSIWEPADAQSVLAVGAINYGNWETGPQEDFSSQGPTNAWAGSNARIKPDICGPDGVSVYTYDFGFLGTSAATPHVAGAAALILSKQPDLSPDELHSVFRLIGVDMGPEGKDNFCGWGRLDMNEYENIAVLGDINGDGKSDIHDLILSLQILSGIESAQIRNNYYDSGADVKKDGKIGLEEAIYIMQKAAGLR